MPVAPTIPTRYFSCIIRSAYQTLFQQCQDKIWRVDRISHFIRISPDSEALSAFPVLIAPNIYNLQPGRLFVWSLGFSDGRTATSRLIGRIVSGSQPVYSTD